MIGAWKIDGKKSQKCQANRVGLSEQNSRGLVSPFSLLLVSDLLTLVGLALQSRLIHITASR